MKNTVSITVRGEVREVTLPVGFTLANVMKYGSVRMDDFVYNEGTRGWERVEMEGLVLVKQCYIVLRITEGQVMECNWCGRDVEEVEKMKIHGRSDGQDHVWCGKCEKGGEW